MLHHVVEGEHGVGGQHAAFGLGARLLPGNPGADDARGLAGPHAHHRLVFNQHDGVGLDVLGRPPGEAQVRLLFIRRGAPSDDLHLDLAFREGVGVLHQKAPLDAAVVGIAALLLPVAGWERGHQNAQVFLLLENFQRRRLVLRGDDDFVKDGAHRLGHLFSYLAVGGHDAPEGGHLVAGEGAAVGLGDIGVAGQPAGVGVLDDGDGRGGEIDSGAPGGVGVQDVVKGKLLAVYLLGPGDAGVLPRVHGQLGVEGGLLVGVLAVAQVLALAHGHGQLLGQARLVLP